MPVFDQVVCDKIVPGHAFTLDMAAALVVTGGPFVAGAEVLASGAISKATLVTIMKPSAADTTFSLADGVEGQMKILCQQLAASSATCIVTLASPGLLDPSATDLDNTLTFNASKELVILAYKNGRWELVTNINGVGVDKV